MWYIIVQTESDIRLILLTKSKDKCIKEYKKLEKEAEKQAKELDETRSVFYYYGHYK